MSMLVLRAPYPSPEPRADTTLITADSALVVTNAPSGLRTQFAAINAALRTEFTRRGLA